MKIEESYKLTEFNSVFEIPIYRLTNSNFVKELDSDVTNAINYSRKDMIENLGKEGKKHMMEFGQISKLGWNINGNSTKLSDG